MSASFKSLLIFALVIVIGGAVALYSAGVFKTAYQAPASEQELTPLADTTLEEGNDAEQIPVTAGEYLVFSTHKDVGEDNSREISEREYAYHRVNIETGELETFATISHPQSVSGGLTTYTYGQNLILHRYKQDNQDAVMSLAGEVLETRPENWHLIRSSNGRYEVDYSDVSSKSDEGTIVVIDTQEQGVLAEFPLKDFETEEEVFELDVMEITDDGEFLFVREVCGCEATVRRIWQVHVPTREITALHDLVDFHDWRVTDIDADKRRMIAIVAPTQRSEDGPYMEILTPTKIQVLDLDTLNVREYVQDDEQAWDNPILDPGGQDRYIIQKWAEERDTHLVPFSSSQIAEQHYLYHEAWIHDWVADWLVLSEDQDYKLLNVDTEEVTNIKFPEGAQSVNYIGSIEIQ